MSDTLCNKAFKSHEDGVDSAPMLIGVALVACMLTVPLLGGRLSRLAELEFRHAWLAVAALAVQVLIISVLPGGAFGLSAEIHLLSYGLLGAFVVLNRRIPGLLVIGLGGALNLAAIASNGGVMPANPAALEAAGLDERAGFANSAPARDAPLGFLGDIFTVPAWFPVHNVFSVGDVLIVLGAFLLLHRAGGSQLPSLPSRSRPAEV